MVHSQLTDLAINCALVIGSGSAGYRHASTLRRHDPDLRIIVVRRSESTQPMERLLALGVELVETIDEASLIEPSVVVVAGPASTHRQDAQQLIGRSRAILVEKPLAISTTDARLLAVAAEAMKTTLIVGYHLRYSSILKSLDALIGCGSVGKVESFSFNVGQHLSQWRPGTDPSQSVSARRELGGGVLLELSHEIDAVHCLLGAIEFCSANLAYHGAPTDGIVETVADLSLVLASGVKGHVHLDMVSEPSFRQWVIEGTEGTLLADLILGTITRSSGGSVELLHRAPYDERDRAERGLINNLLGVALGREVPRCTISDGIAALEVVEAAQHSNRYRVNDMGPSVKVGFSSTGDGCSGSSDHD